MDYPTYPGTDRTMKLGDPVTMAASEMTGAGDILGTILGVELRYDGQAIIVVVDGPEDTYRADPDDLTYRPLPVTVAIPRDLADKLSYVTVPFTQRETALLLDLIDLVGNADPSEATDG